MQGHGFEIKGISGDMMRLFSSRRQSITADVRARATQFGQRYGRKPSQRELAHLAQASNFAPPACGCAPGTPPRWPTTTSTPGSAAESQFALRRELSRRIRDDLIRLGVVQPGPAVTIAGDAPASTGDLIICTRNDHTVQAGEPGRALANGDLLRVEAVAADGLIVRRALDADPASGARRWTDRTFAYQHYGDAELGYAVTNHVAKGRTVTVGLAVITGTEDRQHAYVALTRGTDANVAYVFTVSPKRADPVPGPRPAPELARYDQIQAERDDVHAPAPQQAPSGAAVAVLAGVLDRDGQQRSGHPGPQPGPGRRRPPGPAARDLDRRDHPGP